MTTRDAAIDRIADVFREHGYEGATLRRIAEATGLGRASLYHHFPEGKEDMARSVFERFGRDAQETIVAALEGDAAPRARLERWAEVVGQFYAGGTKNCLLASMVLTGGHELFPEQLRAAFESEIGALARVLEDAGIPADLAKQRARESAERIQGGLIVARALDNHEPFLQMLRELPETLLREAVG